jgi:hypothetical protein
MGDLQGSGRNSWGQEDEGARHYTQSPRASFRIKQDYSDWVSPVCVVILVLICFSQHRVIVNDDLENDGKNPAPLSLPFGKLFFGFHIPPYLPPSPEDEPASKVLSFHLSPSSRSQSSSYPLPSLGRGAPSMGTLLALPLRAQAKGKTIPLKTRELRQTRHGGEQGKDGA